jgi:flagellar motility protein MotE (MotC chaperone)
VSLAGLIGHPATNPAGDEVGRVADVVVRWDASAYPPVTGLVLRVGRRRAFVHAERVADLVNGGARLSSARVDLSDFQHRPGEVALAGDVLDHQLVDVDGVRVVRAADLYLARVGPELRLVAADIGLQTLLRRLGPARWRARPTPARVIDWAAIQPFSGGARDVRLGRANQELRRLRPAELADLVEDLGRRQRRQLLDALGPEMAADVLEELEASDVGAVLRDAPTDRAALLVAGMEPDEAVEALRGFDEEARAELLAAMPSETAAELASLLEHAAGTAGSIMTSRLALARSEETVADVRARLRAELAEGDSRDAVLVVDGDGVLVDDLRLFELFLADHQTRLAELVGEPWPLTVVPDEPLGEVIERFVDERGSSIVVVDAAGRPIGRILADDLVDALTPRRGRLHFHRILG